MKRFRWVLFAWIALLMPLAARADAPTLEGAWAGSLQGMMRLIIHIDRAPDGGLKGTMDSPDQGAMGIAIDTLIATGDSLRFTMRRIGGEYVARRAAPDSLDGTWRQGGMSLPLALKRGGTVPLPKRPQEPLRPLAYDTVAVTFPNQRAPEVTIAGTLTLPKGKGPFAVALLISGSGPEDRDEAVFGHRPFLVLSDHLTRNGIAVLRVDDRGVGGSTGKFSTATSEDFASDALAGVEFLKTRKEIDRKRIGLIGHSEGGLIAPLVAIRSRDVAFIVLMAGPGIPGDSTLVLQTAALTRSMGVPEASIEAQQAVTRRIYGRIQAGDSLGAVAAARELVMLQISALPEAQRAAAGDPDSAAIGAIRRLYSPWMRYFLAFDPRPTLQKVKVPVLAINGEKDVQVLPKENLAALQAAFQAGGLKDATVKELPGLNHLFQRCTTCTLMEYPAIEETIAPAALDEMTQWIQARTATKR
ncbi:MAG TPA: alpha/beta fold hydrolase [Candidatus Eisenbacteria bacterium]|nr:alpha/beta fold hydrolase [Candidatus Eisenbacteria bacterium]